MVTWTLLEIYHGFILKKIEEIKDIHSTAYLFEHEQSGARLIYLKNDDPNKVFSVAFKTPPENDCGTPHILEHSVLCGSRKYAAKDPFNELAKGSLNTFLNAMTYADKTMYPIASCNEKDFHNLMDVYLDAVFFPKIYEKKEIFQQEGWRYVLKEKEAPLEVTGVVYNEMKGALSDPESLLNGAISRSIFGKTTYGFESGGDPMAIPDLTYEAFLSFHQKYYHPSNAYFYLYGDMEPMACLKHIHEGYLSSFTRSNSLPSITESICENKGKWVQETYPAAEEGKEGGVYFAYNLKVGKCTDPERIMALQILSYLLLETNGSPLKTALLDAGICEETEGWFDSSTYEMVFSIIAKNAAVDKAADFVQTIDKEWERLATEGIPRDLLESALRKYDFLLREEDYSSTPKGLVYCSRLMKRWLHGEEPFESLRLLEIMERLKKESKEGYFEKIIESIFLKNDEKTFVSFLPEKGKQKKETMLFSNRLEERKKQMTEQDFTEIQEDARKLERFQTLEDSPEILAQIPVLELSEVEPDAPLIPYQKETLKTGNPLLFVPLESNGILYLKLHFDTSCIPQELLPYVGLLADLLGKLDTQKYAFQELSTVLNRTFGGFSLHHTTYNQNAEKYRSFLTVKGKLLKEDIPMAFSMIQEILFHTKFDSIENLNKVIKSAIIKGENSLLNQSHYFGIYYSGSNLFPGLRIEDLTSGIRYYHFLCNINTQLEKDPISIVENLKKVASEIFCQTNLELAVGCEKSDFSYIKEKLHHFTENLPAGEKKNIVYHHMVYHFDNLSEKMAFTSPGGVLYNTTSVDYRKHGFSYHGKYQVLQTIIHLEYLWNKVRVQGGAYGCGCSFQKSGFSYFYSYRDPHLKETYGIYQNLWREIMNFKASQREMTKYILGTINRLEQPKTNMEKLNTVISQFYKGITEEALSQERIEILQTTVDDIQSCQELLKLIDCENICSIGNEQKIKTNEVIFTNIKPLLS